MVSSASHNNHVVELTNLCTVFFLKLSCVDSLEDMRHLTRWCQHDLEARITRAIIDPKRGRFLVICWELKEAANNSACCDQDMWLCSSHLWPLAWLLVSPSSSLSRKFVQDSVIYIFSLGPLLIDFQSGNSNSEKKLFSGQMDMPMAGALLQLAFLKQLEESSSMFPSEPSRLSIFLWQAC